MATEAEMKKIAVKAIEDDTFRAVLEADPEKAVGSMGITLTPEQLAEVKKRKSQAEAAGAREAKAAFVHSGWVVA